MDKKKSLVGTFGGAAIFIVVVFLIIAGIVFFIMTRIRIGFTLDEFKFMGHSLTEGDQLNDIMQENDIEYFAGAVCDQDFYAQKNTQGQIYIMCPAYHQQDDAPGSTIPEEERRKEWLSGYVVTDPSTSNYHEVVSITAYAGQKRIDEYYEGPIQIGDSLEEIQSIMQIEAIKRYGLYDKDARNETYEFFCTQGKIIFEEKCSGSREEYDGYTDKLAYLADDHYITYMFHYPDYILSVRFGTAGTVEYIGVTYDPAHVIDHISNPALLIP